MPRFRCAGCDKLRNIAYARPDLIITWKTDRCKTCGSYTLKLYSEQDFDSFSRAFFKRPDRGWRRQRRTAIRMKQRGIVHVSLNIGLTNGKENTGIKNGFPGDNRTFGCNAQPVPLDWWEVERVIDRRNRRLSRWPYNRYSDHRGSLLLEPATV
jgi:hypothetical protein